MGEIFVDISPNDTRKYKLLTLANGLRTLLISDRDDDTDDAEDMDGSESSDEMDTDEEEDDCPEDSPPRNDQAPMQAHAALCVQAGAFLDPEDLPGLAHYLEHMVFMGCKKFDVVNDWDKLVKEVGLGDSNAQTNFETEINHRSDETIYLAAGANVAHCGHVCLFGTQNVDNLKAQVTLASNMFQVAVQTEFHFFIHSTHFEQALEHFAEFFISPLFKEENMASELLIIDNEFSEARLDDRSRMESLLALTAKKGHPIRNFAWGNQQSLKVEPDNLEINVRERIMAFFDEHYVAQKMTLCVLSNETLSTLEEWVTKYFSKIRQSQSMIADYRSLGNPYDTPEFTKLFKVIPVKNVRQLQITWSFPSLISRYRTRPEAYIGAVLGHEGKWSLLSTLAKRGFGVSLEAGVRANNSDQEHNSTCSCFVILISLTQLGLDKIDEVVLCVFEYLRMMRDHGPKKEIWEEINYIEKADFRYMEPETDKFPLYMAQNLIKYHPRDIVSAHYIQQLEYDAEHIKWLLGFMTADKINLMIVSQHFATETCTKFFEEKWFKTKYSVEDIPREWTQKWLCAVPTPEIRYPDKNEYIPTDFSTKLLPKKSGPKLEEPVLQVECAELWYDINENTAIPKAYAYFYLKSIHVCKSPATKAMMDLYGKLVHVHLTEMSYPAAQASLHAEVVPQEYGLEIKISGFNNKLPLYFSNIVNEIQDCVVNEEIFENLKAELNDDYLNSSACPQRLNREFCQAALRKEYWTTIDKRKALNDVTVTDMKAFVGRFFDGMFVQGLVQGNLFEEQAKLMLTFLQKTLQIQCPADDFLGLGYVSEIPRGNTLYCVKNMNPCDDQTVILNYYQFEGIGTPLELLLNEIFVASMEQPIFYFLRTKHNVAYSPNASTENLHNIIGFSITVITSATKFTAKKIDDYIESFLVDYNKQVQAMTQDTFDNFIKLQRDSRTLEETILKEEVDRHWREVLDHTFKFETQEKERELLGEITLERFKKWSHAHLLPSENRRKLSIQVVGHSGAGNEETGAECTGFDDTVIPCIVDEVTRNSYSVIDNLAEFSSTSCRRFAVNLFTDHKNNTTRPPVYYSD